ncbi:MAG: damage-inducible protein CinA [Cycloclasticus sp.]|nr:MAG: damage-inducible protein CinA [Cycloclasticus sp.]
MNEEITNQVAKLAKILREQGRTVSVAESCTGGWLAKELTDLSGSSEWFVGGVISYSNEAKQNVLNVDAELLDGFGAVSQPVAEAMAENVQRIFTSSIAVSITGIAGPSGGTTAKPVGLVWFGLKTEAKGVESSCMTFQGNRNNVRFQAVNFALGLMIQALET